MATATKSKPPAATSERAPSADGMGRAGRVIAEQTEMYEAAEDLLARRAAGEPDPNDGTVYMALGWEPPEIKRQVERRETVAAFSRRAGTAADRAQAEQERKAATEDARVGNAKDLVMVQEAQARIAKRNDRLGAADRRVFGYSEALRVLRDPKLLPDHLNMRLRMDRSVCDHPDRQRLTVARGRIRSIDGILALRADDQLENIRLHCYGGVECGEALHAWGTAGPGRAEFPSTAWATYVAGLSAERTELAALVDELTPAERERQVAFNVADYHVDKLG